MISVETKTFEFGVMRMVGLSKTGIINVIILQSFMYVVPAMLVGFVCSVPALILIYTIIFNDESLAE
jgi:ABC-type antimicrobial peptide transport system permease subunit